MFKTVIIDDEPSALNLLKEDLTSHFNNDIQIIATSNSFDEGLLIIKEYNPDLVFLDIDLGKGKTGFDLLKKAREFNPNFKVVFSTAFNQFAIKAIREQAFDYLLKPVDLDDLSLTINRLKENNELKSTYKDFIILNNSDELHKLFVKDILYIESSNGYVEFYLEIQKKPILTSLSLQKIENELSVISNDFYRIHKSYIINLNKVKRIKKGISSKFVILTNETKIPISRTHYNDFTTRFIQGK